MKKIHPLYVTKRKTHFQNQEVATFSHVLSSRFKYKPKILYLWDSFRKVGTVTRHSLVCYSSKESSDSGFNSQSKINHLRVPNSIEVSNFIVSKFYVIIAYRTILRENIGKYISPSTTTVLFCSSLPFFVCLSQVGLGNYQNKYSQNILVRNPFPALKAFDPKVSWETYNHLGYGNKLNLDQIEKVYHCPESVVIELNSNWFNQQNNNRVGFFKSNLDQTLKQLEKRVGDHKTLQATDVNFDLWSYIPGRNLTSDVNCQLTVKENRLPWTMLFNNYDDIPSKLAPIFNFELTFKQLKPSLHKSSLHPVDNLFDLECSKPDPKQDFQGFKGVGADLNAVDIVRISKQIINQNDAGVINLSTKKNNFLTFEKLNPNINFIALDSSYQESKVKIKVSNHALKSTPLVNYYGKNLFNGLYENFPILGSRRLVQHNLFNSLALFGNQLALTGSSQVVTNQFDTKVCSQNPEHGFVQRKQAFVYDLGLGSNFQGKGVRACKQFELRFFEQLKTYLHLPTSLPQNTEGRNQFSTTKYANLLLQYFISDSTQVLAFPMKYDFLSPETRITSSGVIKRKLSGYLHPDSSIREVYFPYGQANPLTSVYNSIVQGKKQLKIDYGSNLANRFGLQNKFNTRKLNSALPKKNHEPTLRLADRFLGQKTTFTAKKQFTNRQMVKKYMRQRGELRLKSYTNSLPSFTTSPIKCKASKVNFKLPDSKVQREFAQFTTTLCSSGPRQTTLSSLAPIKFAFNQPYIGGTDPIIRIPWHSIETPQLYKNHWNYTQFDDKGIINLALTGEVPKSKKFVTELYEPITKHSWAILCQVGFVFIVSVLFNIVQREYRDELLNYIETLSIYLSSDDQAKIKNASVEQRYTVIRNSNYRFNTTVQNPQVLPKVADVILYLINTRHLGCLIPIVWQNVPGPCRAAFLSNSGDPVTPKGFLLVGPPGAGKTVFVKALAGEAGVALIMESGKNFHFELDFHGGDKLTKLFTAAKRIGPSLVFFDEIDIIGRSRTGVEAVHGEEYEARFPSVVNLPYESNVSNVHASNDPLDKNPVLDPLKRFNDYVELVPGSMFVNDVSALEKSLEKRTILNYREHINDVMLVTQLLSLMDGLTSREKVLIIGATDKPSILDPALTRPGRLDKVVYLDLPGRRKRFELFQFYSKVGTDESINWNYFAKLSMGLSAAHISAAMNWSLLKAIYNTQFKSSGCSSDLGQTSVALSVPVLTKKIAFFQPKRQTEVHHTFDTILHGIEMISSTSSQANGSWFKMAEKVNFKLLGHFNCSRLTSGPWVPFILNRSLFYDQLVFKFEHDKKATEKSKPTFQVTANSNRQLQKGNFLQGQKQSFQKPVGRCELYKNNRKYLRTLKYTSLVEFCTKDKSTLNKVGSPKTDLLANQALTVVKRYFSRMMQSQTFGWHLLSESTINAKNTFFYQRNMDYLNQMVPAPQSVFHFKHHLQQNCKQISNIFQFHSVGSEFSPDKAIFYCQSSVKSLYRLNKKVVNEELSFNPSLNLVYYDLLNLSLTRTQKKTGLKWKQHSLDLSYSLFQDDLYILRPAYYLSGQCLLNTILPNQIDRAQQFSLRSLIGSDEAQMSEIETSIFFKHLQEKLITKYQFECYLLVSLGGKIAETLMLVSNNSKNDSDLGIGQLKNAGSILTMMITKHLLFWPKQLLFEQDSITMNRNENNFPSQPERVVFQQLTRRYENRLQSGTFLPNSTETRAELIDHIQRPWWQFQALNSFSTNNTLRAKWYRFCLYNVIANEKNNMWLPAEKYYSNQTFQCFSQVNLVCKQNDTDVEFETFSPVSSASAFLLFWFYSNWDKFYLFLGVQSNMIFKLLYFYLKPLTPRWKNQVKFNHQSWNTIESLHKDVLIGNFIFELFNKPFGLLENNRQLLDSFVYKLLCFEKIGPTQIENAYSAYFDDSKPQWLVTANELETTYFENVLRTDEKNR